MKKETTENEIEKTDQETLSFGWGGDTQSLNETRRMMKESLEQIPTWSNDVFHFL